MNTGQNLNNLDETRSPDAIEAVRVVIISRRHFLGVACLKAQAIYPAMSRLSRMISDAFETPVRATPNYETESYLRLAGLVQQLYEPIEIGLFRAFSLIFISEKSAQMMFEKLEKLKAELASDPAPYFICSTGRPPSAERISEAREEVARIVANKKQRTNV
jgi:hypothetical protein